MMAKRSDKGLLDRIKSDPGGGLSRDILDVAFWRAEHEADDEWVAAIFQIDHFGDKKPLQDLLRHAPLPGRAGEYLADLIERGVRPAKGRPRVPMYKVSAAEGALLVAHGAVRSYVQNGFSVKDAVEVVARERGLDEDKLMNSYRGKRGSMTRRKKVLRGR
jgi:hypothetical protein